MLWVPKEKDGELQLKVLNYGNGLDWPADGSNLSITEAKYGSFVISSSIF